MFLLLAGEPAEAGVRRILEEKIDESASIAAAFDSSPEETVHALRKNLKRIRAALRLLSDSRAADEDRALERHFRDLGRRFAGLRDATVYGETLEALTSDMEPGAPHPFPETRRLIAAESESLYSDALASGMLIEAAAATLSDGNKKLDAMEIRLAVRKDLRVGFRRAYRRTRRACKAAYTPPLEPEKFHAWRKRVKALWHQCEILLPADTGAAADLAADLEHLSGLLGKAHDAAALQAWLTSRAGSLPISETGILASRLRRSRVDFEGAARPHGEALLAPPFKEFESAFLLSA